MQWLGSMANSNGLVYTWHESGIRTLEDAKQREVPMGAVGTASDSFIFVTIINELLGTKFKAINGYAGSTQIHLAMERREVMGRGGNSWASVQTANKSWLTEHKINILVQFSIKSLSLWLRNGRSRTFLNFFWNATSLDAVAGEIATHGARDPFSHLTSAAERRCPRHRHPAARQ